jgi:endoglucanase
MKDIRQPDHPRRRGRGRLAGLLMALLVILGLAGSTALAAPGGAAPAAPRDTAGRAPSAVRVPARAMDAGAAMQPSWNLGNTLDAFPEETSWGNKATRELFAAIREEGFRSVRIPVTWTDHQSTTAPYTVDAAYMSRVKEVVDWALDEGLYVVLNVHHDSWMWIDDIAADHDAVMARYNSTWTQISRTFRDKPRTLIFESVNEPVFEKATAEQKTTFLRELNTSFHKIVRSSGGGNANRLLMLPTQGCTPSQTLMDDLYTTIRSLNDRQLIATVHYYSYYPFSVNTAGGTHYDDITRSDLDDAFARMHNTFVARGIPVYVGEYGLLGYPDHNHASRVERGEALKYYEHFSYAARLAKVTTALWDPGTWAYLDRDTLKWTDPALMTWIKSTWTARSATASFDKVFLEKKEPITAKGVTLNLNGTKFRGLWHGRTKLVEGRDYTLWDKTRLVITAGMLTRLSSDREYGVNATLEARFSRGLPWQIEVVTYDEAVLSDATGRTDGFTIPVQYKGDVLSAMEARYPDGAYAGTKNWTPYQEFNESFSPDYANGTIVLKPDFLKSLRDGEPVTLTFNFYSGKKVLYHIKKSGDSITGTHVAS